jgi:hypothetical protein
VPARPGNKVPTQTSDFYPLEGFGPDSEGWWLRAVVAAPAVPTVQRHSSAQSPVLHSRQEAQFCQHLTVRSGP